MDPITVATIVSALSTIVLVIITGYYAMQTRRQAEFLREQISTSIRPFLQVESFKCKTNVEAKPAESASRILVPEWALSIINVGNGAALDVVIEVSADISVKEGDKVSSPHRVDFTSLSVGRDIYLRPGQAETYPLTAKEKENSHETIKPGYVLVHASCKDVSGKELKFRSEVWLGYDELTWDVGDTACILPFEQAYPKKLLA